MSDTPQSGSSRRDFVKGTAAAAIGTSLLGGFNTARVYAASEEKLKVGLIGCGGRGTGAAIQALSTEGNVQLTAMADAFEDSLNNSLSNIKSQFTDRPERIAVADDQKFVGLD